MKTLFKLFTIAICTCLVSCASKNNLPEPLVKELTTKELDKDNLSTAYSSITVGYYEEDNEDERYELRKLAAAGVITYKVERIEIKKRVWDGFDYKGYTFVDRYKTITEYKYFVETALTAKGDSLSVISIPMYTEEPDEYLKTPPYQVYPEDTVSRTEIFKGDIKENANDTKTPQKKEIVEKQQEPKTDYEKAKAKEHKETKYVKLYSRKVTDARNILVCDGSASADVVIDCYDVSPFGRILSYARESFHDICTISLVYYQDKGWVIKDMGD